MHMILKREDPHQKQRLRKIAGGAFGAVAGGLATLTAMGNPAFAVNVNRAFDTAMAGIEDMEWPEMKISYDMLRGDAANDSLPAPIVPRGYDANGRPIVDCSDNKPVVFRGHRHDFVVTNPSVCYDLKRMLPAENQTVQFTPQIKLTGLADGAVRFQLNDMEPVDIPHDTYRGFLEAWLVTGGQTGTPVAATYFFSKWHLESRFGQLMRNPQSSACGVNQFIPGTFIQQADMYGDEHGYASEENQASAFASRYAPKDYGKASDDADYLAWFDVQCERPFMSMVLGVRYAINGAQRMEELVHEGKIILPDNRQYLTPTDWYIGVQLLGTGENGAQLFYRALRDTPNKTMREIMPADVYASNDYFFEEQVPVIDPETRQQQQERVADIDPETHQQRRDPQTNEPLFKLVGVTRTRDLTVREFYEQEVATKWGFGHEAMPSMAGWEANRYIANGTIHVQPRGNAQPRMGFLQAGYDYIFHARNDVQVVQIAQPAPTAG